MSASAFPDTIYGMKPAYASSGLKKIYNKQIKVVKFSKLQDSTARYVAKELYRYNCDGTFRVGTPPSTRFDLREYIKVHDGVSVESPHYGIDYTLFLEQDMAYISKVKSIRDLKNSYTAELQRLQSLFDKNVPNLDGHDKAVQAIKEEHPEKFI